jgi:NADPH2:quinone reductase
MRALLCTELGPVERLQVTDVPDPVPSPGEVVVEVAAAGVNFADTLMVAGMYQVRPELPFSPGFEAAGVVSAVGDGVDMAVGARVIAHGAYGAFAEQWKVEATKVLPLPDELSFERAAGFGVAYGTAYHALVQQGRLTVGEWLLVLGAAGGVGSAAVDIGHALGATVIAAAGSDEKLEFARTLGADLGINYTTDDLKTRIRELTSGRGVDIVLDPVGDRYTEPALRALAWGGRLLVIGFAAGEIPRIPANLLLLRESSAVGVYWGNWVERDPAGYAANHRELMTLLQDGKVTPHAPQVFPLEDHHQAFSAILNRTARGKVVLQIGDVNDR